MADGDFSSDPADVAEYEPDEPEQSGSFATMQASPQSATFTMPNMSQAPQIPQGKRGWTPEQRQEFDRQNSAMMKIDKMYANHEIDDRAYNAGMQVLFNRRSVMQPMTLAPQPNDEGPNVVEKNGVQFYQHAPGQWTPLPKKPDKVQKDPYAATPQSMKSALATWQEAHPPTMAEQLAGMKAKMPQTDEDRNELLLMHHHQQNMLRQANGVPPAPLPPALQQWQQQKTPQGAAQQVLPAAIAQQQMGGIDGLLAAQQPQAPQTQATQQAIQASQPQALPPEHAAQLPPGTTFRGVDGKLYRRRAPEQVTGM